MAVVELDEPRLRVPRREFARALDRHGVVAAAVEDQRRARDVGKADVDALGILDEAEVDARGLPGRVVGDLAPAGALPVVPRRPERLAPPLRELERGREQHERGDARLACRHARRGEPAERAADQHGRALCGARRAPARSSRRAAGARRLGTRRSSRSIAIPSGAKWRSNATPFVDLRAAREPVHDRGTACVVPTARKTNVKACETGKDQHHLVRREGTGVAVTKLAIELCFAPMVRRRCGPPCCTRSARRSHG